MINEEQNLNEPEKPQLNMVAVMRSIYFWLYAMSKLGMLYVIIQENWIALVGFAIATGVSYVEMMKHNAPSI
jgi:hypothetical protein